MKAWTLLALLLVGPALAQAASINTSRPPRAEARQLAIEDLSASYPQQYTRGPEFLQRLASATNEAQVAALAREALLAHPLLDGMKLLVVRRDPRQLGLPANWEGNCSLPRQGYDNEVAVLSDLRGGGTLTPLYRPPDGGFVGDVDLDFDAKRILFSQSSPHTRWRVMELDFGAAAAPKSIAQIDEPDVDNYDACYLPDGNIIFSSSAPFTGVPCVGGSAHVANFYRLERGSGAIRRLTFDQDHDWCPTVMNDGKVMYLRWEYSDLPHFVSRILFQMNPDGTEQREHYGSNSYWPNSTFFARPVPGSSTRFVGVVSGHHDTPRMGDLILFDVAKGRHEADGVVQRIPGRGVKVEPVIRDGLTQANWPKFLHPWPLSDGFFLTAGRPSAAAPWGIYLADVFDNLVLIKELPGQALLEPVPLQARVRPPVLASRVQPERKDATVYLTDVYAGPGLAGVPRGTVKKLRLFTYHFAYQGMGGQVHRIGFDGPWDIKRIIGTVPVEADGSAFFRVPANTPISIQPLDEQGHALQLMRSWTTAMPGESVSCTGCHEPRNESPPTQRTLALARAPSEITPFYGPTRGFAFRREVQPALDRHCVACHDEYRDGPDQPMGARHAAYNQPFPPSYLALRRAVRAPTIESDMNLLIPGEFHADTTDLFQLLDRGHYDVKLDAESRDRIATWLDLNTPGHGTWQEIVPPARVVNQQARRAEMLRRYAGIDENPEQISAPPAPISPPPPVGRALVARRDTRVVDGLRPAEALQKATAETRNLDLGGGVTLALVKIPAAKPFWMGRCEISNQQYAQFDPGHDSGIEVGDFLQFSEQERGFLMNQPDQPAVRVSQLRAGEFCRWLSAKTGLAVDLPDAEQWALACRAGGTNALWYGPPAADFSRVENLADLAYHTVSTHGWDLPSGAIPAWRPAATNCNDGYRVSAPVGHFAANAWGLCDLHGNVSEWTRSDATGGRKAVCGGSFADRPEAATADSRRSYPAWRRVYNVGFRVVVEEGAHAITRN
jgi:formylglycine-generating enzyme required for sulfatase activity